MKPIGQLLERWHTARAARAAAVVGAGAAGVEIIMALHHRQPLMRCTLIDRAPHILDGLPAGLQRRVMAELARQQIDVVTDASVSGVEADTVRLADGRSLPSHFTVWATGAAAPRWLRDCGLALDPGGFIATGPTLQSLSHPEVFAAGDVATMIDSPRPKSGVFAVRAGPPLAANLLRAARGDTLQPWTPQTHALLLLACGRRHAIASRGGWSLQGDWVWRWKDRIDRAFMRRFGG